MDQLSLDKNGMCMTTTSKQSQFRTFCMSGRITRLSIRELSSYGFLNYLFLPKSKKICTLTLLLVSINAVLKSIGDELSFICCTLPKMLAKCNFLNRLRCSQFRTVFMSSENCHKVEKKNLIYCRQAFSFQRFYTWIQTGAQVSHLKASLRNEIRYHANILWEYAVVFVEEQSAGSSSMPELKSNIFN